MSTGMRAHGDGCRREPGDASVRAAGTGAMDARVYCREAESGSMGRGIRQLSAKSVWSETTAKTRAVRPGVWAARRLQWRPGLVVSRAAHCASRTGRVYPRRGGQLRWVAL